MQINIKCIKKAQLCQRKEKQNLCLIIKTNNSSSSKVTKHKTDRFLMPLLTLSGNQDTKLLDADFFVLVLL